MEAPIEEGGCCPAFLEQQNSGAHEVIYGLSESKKSY
jgi:hypothetical protein